MAKYNSEIMKTFGSEVPENIGERADYRVHRLIVRANHNMSLEQSKVFHVVLSKVSQQRRHNIEVTKEEFFDLMGLTGGDRWERYKPIFKSLIDKTTILKESNKPKDSGNSNVVINNQNSPVSSQQSYIKDENTFYDSVFSNMINLA